MANKANNPLSDVWLMIVENDTSILRGKDVPGDQILNATLIEPVMPVPVLDQQWNLIFRPVIPIVSAPIDEDAGRLFGRSNAESLLAQLNGADCPVDTTGFGDSLMLPGDYDRVFEDEVARGFGSGFADALANLPVGRWSGPVESGFGLHLVLIRERQPRSHPALAEVRAAVEREWRNARGEEAAETFYRGLRARYVISVERPEGNDGGGGPKVAEARP